MTRTKQVAARLKEDLREELKMFAAILEVPESQLVRQAIKEKIEELKKDPRIRAVVERNAPVELATVGYE